MEASTDNLSFQLDLPHLGVSGRWTPTAGERGICQDIVRLTTTTHRVPSRDTDPCARYTTMAMFFYAAMKVVRAAPPGALPTIKPIGELAPSSLAVFLMHATSTIGERLDGLAIQLGDDYWREITDQIEPEVLEFRRAIGITGDGAATFWTPAGPGETQLWTVKPPQRRRRFRWWGR